MTSLTATSNHIPLFFITLASRAVKLYDIKLPFCMGIIHTKKSIFSKTKAMYPVINNGACSNSKIKQSTAASEGRYCFNIY